MSAVSESELLGRINHELPVSSVEEIHDHLAQKAEPILRGSHKGRPFFSRSKEEILLVGNLYPDKTPDYDPRERFLETIEGYKRKEPETLREGVRRFAESLNCDVDQPIKPRCRWNEFCSGFSDALIEERVYPTKDPNIVLVFVSHHDADKEGTLRKVSLLIRRVNPPNHHRDGR